MPFHLHPELLYTIKGALHSKQRSGPECRIELPFDKFLYGGGLVQCGTKLREFRGETIYGIKRYSDLNPILGENWHTRVLNKRMDFCYVVRETVQFHLHKRRPLLDFQPDSERQAIPGGHVLVFKFVRGNGVKRQWEDIAKLD